MAAARQDIFFMLKSKQRRLEVEKNEFYHMLVKENSTNNNEISRQIKAGINGTAASSKI